MCAPRSGHSVQRCWADLKSGSLSGLFGTDQFRMGAQDCNVDCLRRRGLTIVYFTKEMDFQSPWAPERNFCTVFKPLRGGICDQPRSSYCNGG